MPARGVEDRGEHDGERSDDRQLAARWRAACDEGNSDEPEADAGDPGGADALVREELEPDQQREDRDRRLGDAGCARVDVLLAPGDEPERGRGVEEPEHDRLAPGLAEPRRPPCPVPIVAMRYASRTTPAISVRAAISAPGEKPPSTPTLMKRYDAPQREASVRRSGQYLLVTL